MSFVHRILSGLEFHIDAPTGVLNWPAETEDVARLSVELARVTRSGLAFAAVARPPAGEYGCQQVDDWLARAELHVEQITSAASVSHLPIEQGAWLGEPIAEWGHSARESEMDLLIVPRAAIPSGDSEQAAELELPQLAGCPVWFAGREPDRLEAAPPLIAFCDDLSSKAADQFPLAIELAQNWNARLLIVHPVAEPEASLPKAEVDRLRQVIFQRLSRTDFRSLSHGSQLRLLCGDLSEILHQISEEQVPNLLMSSRDLVNVSRPAWRGHLWLWPSDKDANGARA